VVQHRVFVVDLIVYEDLNQSKRNHAILALVVSMRPRFDLIRFLLAVALTRLRRVKSRQKAWESPIAHVSDYRGI
jgi:hypothetical protein